jgi:hypothetical protein
MHGNTDAALKQQQSVPAVMGRGLQDHGESALLAVVSVLLAAASVVHPARFRMHASCSATGVQGGGHH